MSDNKQQQADAQKELEQLKARNAELEKQLAEERAQKEEAEKLAKEKSDLLDMQVSQQEALIARQLRKQRKVRIVIQSGRTDHERSPVPVAVNGHEYLIERDKEVDVPEGVVNVLKLANEQVAQTTDGAQVNTTFHTAARFAYRIIGHIDPKTGDLVKA